MNKLLVILGPTVTGKTDLALSMAKKFNGELVACDSRQVYRGLDIGTGKLPGGGKWEVRRGSKRWEVGGVKIWLYDVVSAKKQYTVYDYVGDANRVIGQINKRGKLPIIVGGTGFYLKALLEGLPNLSVPVDKALRERLESLSLKDLQNKLQKASFEKWQKMSTSDRQNSRRLIRAVELLMIYPHKKETKSYTPFADVLKIGLTAPRPVLFEKINDRVFKWLKQGIIDEVEKLLKKGVSKKRIENLGLEYKVILEYLDKKISYLQLIEKMQNKTRQYARRQITWFKKDKRIAWFDVTKRNYISKIEKRISKWYDM